MSVKICFKLAHSCFSQVLTETTKKSQVCVSSKNEGITRTAVLPMLLKELRHKRTSKVYASNNQVCFKKGQFGFQRVKCFSFILFFEEMKC